MWRTIFESAISRYDVDAAVCGFPQAAWMHAAFAHEAFSASI